MFSRITAAVSSKCEIYINGFMRRWMSSPCRHHANLV